MYLAEEDDEDEYEILMAPGIIILKKSEK